MKIKKKNVLYIDRLLNRILNFQNMEKKFCKNLEKNFVKIKLYWIIVLVV